MIQLQRDKKELHPTLKANNERMKRGERLKPGKKQFPHLDLPHISAQFLHTQQGGSTNG